MATGKKKVVLVMILLLVISTTISKGVREEEGMRHRKRHSAWRDMTTINGSSYSEAYCLSWRMAVEANNMRGWRTIPLQCLRHVQGYMVGGQYFRDISLIIDQIYAYLDMVTVTPFDDDLDAWIFDIDDTCLSNLFYYRAKRFGCDPYNPTEFKAWASGGEIPAIPAVLDLFKKLIEVGLKVILLTGRDEETLGEATVNNLLNQGFVGYERLIMRSAEYRGQSAIMYKSEIRRQLIMEQGYRIWGNVGDQWSDLQGNFTGDRTFKIPNPMYFVP